VIAADDPARVFEQLSTLDAISEGRAQLMVGYGAYREAFELFGHAGADYTALFCELVGF
jgi:alkanesulfonate monooxygenase SsuD/methylene tetrahydromethanopterin reductase-like flavin-dependent oxidoreductase (luciferase family)